jgi:hypothetical protein
MNARPTIAHPSSLSITDAAAWAAYIAIGLLTAVASRFQHDAALMAQLTASERALRTSSSDRNLRVPQIQLSTVRN